MGLCPSVGSCPFVGLRVYLFAMRVDYVCSGILLILLVGMSEYVCRIEEDRAGLSLNTSIKSF